MSKFIYIFGEDAKNILLAENYTLLKSDTKNNIYVFENKPGKRFQFNHIKYALSDTLTF